MRTHECSVREPYAVNPHVRFDERDVETESTDHRATSHSTCRSSRTAGGEGDEMSLCRPDLVSPNPPLAGDARAWATAWLRRLQVGNLAIPGAFAEVGVVGVGAVQEPFIARICSYRRQRFSTVAMKSRQ